MQNQTKRATRPPFILADRRVMSATLTVEKLCRATNEAVSALSARGIGDVVLLESKINGRLILLRIRHFDALNGIKGAEYTGKGTDQFGSFDEYTLTINPFCLLTWHNYRSNL